MKFDFVRYLNPSKLSSTRDQAYFKRLEKKEISIEECKYLFKNSNSIPQKVYETITNEQFAKWLNSLGWNV